MNYERNLGWNDESVLLEPDSPDSRVQPRDEGEPGAASAMRRLQRERVAADAPDPRVGDAVDRAKRRLAASATSRRGRDAAWKGLALLAIGEFAPAYDVLRLLGARQDTSGRIPDGDDSPRDVRGATDHYLLLAARTFAWTGDVSQLGGEWDRVRRAARFALRAGTGTEAFARVTMHELAVAAESMGDADLAGALRVARPIAAPDRPEGPALESGSDAAALPYDGTDDAALFLLRLVHGLIGADPDAARSRLVLRPRIPSGWDRLEVVRLRIGDSAIALRYHRDGPRHVFQLEQERGAVPLSLIFEPRVPMRALARARVDGEPAELDPRRAGPRLIVPVQLVLDHERMVELEAAPDLLEND